MRTVRGPLFWRLGAFFFALFVSSALNAEERKPALEIDLYTGYSRQVAPKVDSSSETWSRNGGLTVQAGLVLRTSVFLGPFLEAGYTQLYASNETKDLGPGLGTVSTQNSLSALSFVSGPALDLYRFRLRLGIGVYQLRVESTLGGVTITPSELDLGYFLGLGAALWRSGPWRVGLESRAFLIAEAETAALSLGLFGSWDAVRW